MMPLPITILHGLLICIPFSLFAFISFWWRPRLWLHSLPIDIQQLAKPKTEIEKRLTRYLLLPLYLLILPGLSIGSAWYVANAAQIDWSFPGLLIHIYGIWIIVHVWDFLIIDGVSILRIDMQHPPIPGTEGAKGWKNYSFHFRSLLKAIIMSALFVIPAAAILSFIL